MWTSAEKPPKNGGVRKANSTDIPPNSILYIKSTNENTTTIDTALLVFFI